MHTLIIANQKGGVGKSTTTVNLGAGLARLGFAVLIIDIDPQGHSTIGLNISTEGRQTVAELLTEDGVQASDVIQSTETENLDIMPSDLSLAIADFRLSSEQNKEFRLRKKLLPIENQYDFALIDSPPTFGTLTMNAFTAGNEIILPMQLGYLSLQGVSNFIDTLNFVNEEVNSIINHNIEIGGVLLTFFNTRTKLSKEVYAAVDKIFDKKVFEAKIPQNIKLGEAQSHGQSIFQYDARCKGAKAYEKLAEEISRKYAKGEKCPTSVK